MADNTEIIDLHNAIKLDLENKYPNYTIGDFDEIEDTIPTPSIYINIINQFDNSDNSGQLNNVNLLVNPRLELYIFNSKTTNKNILIIKQFALNLSRYINGKTFGQNIDPIKFLTGDKVQLPIEMPNLISYMLEFDYELLITGTGN